MTPNAWHRRIPESALIVPWLLALVSYFAPWISRQPMSAALAWNAYDMFDLLRLLPDIETGALSVNLQTLRLPLLGLAILLPTILAAHSRAVRIGAALIGCALAAMTLPPYPQILDAWHTPGWRVPFWWGIGVIGLILGSIVLAPKRVLAPKWAQYRPWGLVIVVALSTVPATVTLFRLLPALSSLHSAPVTPGWGLWGCIGGMAAMGLFGWWQAIHGLGRIETTGDDAMSQTEKATHWQHVLQVKEKHEASLLQKPNVVAVGIGIPRQTGEPIREPGIVVSVTRQVDTRQLAPEDRIPRELEGVRVWVEEIASPRAISTGEEPKEGGN